MDNLSDRFKEYTESHCWQFDIRLRNREFDLKEASLTEELVKDLKISNFEFSYIDKTNKEQCKQLIEFIHKHEWLGIMPLRPTQRFVAKYKGILAGVIIMATPNTFATNLLGKDKRDLEKLISRGACISWSPKNLASSLLMFAIHWMVQNTTYRLFTAYSDIEAKELGTIYQACNFYYLGRDKGTKKMYCDLKGTGRWFSDRAFRTRSAYKRYAKQLGIEWNKNWSDEKDRIIWRNMSKEIELAIRQKAKDYAKTCQFRLVPSKHKYCYILGKNHKETKELRRLFESLHKKLPYPKIRGE